MQPSRRASPPAAKTPPRVSPCYWSAGLGNPGREHARNRHNAGWMVVDELARRHGGSWRGKFSGQLAEVRARRRAARAAEAGDVHERLRALGRAGGRVLQAGAERGARRPRRGRLRSRPARAQGGRRPRRPQRAALDRATARHAGLPPPARSASAARSGAIPVRSPTGCSRTSSRRTIRTTSSRARRMPSRLLVADGVEQAQLQVNRR